jgi:hypothetical protein
VKDEKRKKTGGSPFFPSFFVFLSSNILCGDLTKCFLIVYTNSPKAASDAGFISHKCLKNLFREQEND